MKMVKSLILGSAAGLVAMTGAQAADLPVKAKAVEYVKVCSLYGAGFYYIPGTDTCIKLGGYLRADTTFNGGGAYNMPAWSGGAAYGTRDRSFFLARSRLDFNIDTRTATEYGVVRTFADVTFNWTSGDGVAGGSLGVYYAFVQFAGFTIGKAVSQFDTPWTGYPGNNTSFLIGGYDDVTGINQLAYTAQFGNGIQASISVEDPTSYTRNNLANAVTTLGVNNVYGGFVAPDIVGHVRIDQAWGLFQVSAAAHNIHSLYYGATELTGHPSDKWGFAVQGALSLKNLPTGPGDSINITGTYAQGASRYVFGGVSGSGSYFMFGSSGAPGAYQSLAFGNAVDGVYGVGTGIETITTYGVRGAFNHNFDPYWSASLFGSWAKAEYSSNAKALYCGAYAGIAAGQGVSYTCNPDFQIAQLGGVLRWTPVKGLAFSGEVMYTWLDTGFSGTATLSPGGFKPTATYEFKDQGTLSGILRVNRVF